MCLWWRVNGPIRRLVILVTSWCMSLTCFFKLPFFVKDFSQMSHLWFFKFRWTAFVCAFKRLFIAKDVSHSCDIPRHVSPQNRLHNLNIELFSMVLSSNAFCSHDFSTDHGQHVNWLLTKFFFSGNIHEGLGFSNGSRRQYWQIYSYAWKSSWKVILKM